MRQYYGILKNGGSCPDQCPQATITAGKRLYECPRGIRQVYERDFAYHLQGITTGLRRDQRGTRTWGMKTMVPITPCTSVPAALKRYQVFRQTDTGVHHEYGVRTSSLEAAVEVFLDAPPCFDGGDIRLWDYVQHREVATTRWTVETTGFDFPVRIRANVYHDLDVARVAHQLIEREAFFLAVGERGRLNG